MTIDATHVYASLVGVTFIVCVLLSRLRASSNLIRRLMRQHLLYPYLIRRHRLLGPWTRAAVLVQCCFVLANAFCISFKVSSIRDASQRAARLALLNLVPAYGGTHLSFLADTCGVSLHTIQVIHRSAGAMSVPLLAFHIATILALRTPFSLHVAENMWALIVSLLVSSVVLLSKMGGL